MTDRQTQWKGWLETKVIGPYLYLAAHGRAPSLGIFHSARIRFNLTLMKTWQGEHFLGCRRRHGHVLLIRGPRKEKKPNCTSTVRGQDRDRDRECEAKTERHHARSSSIFNNNGMPMPIQSQSQSQSPKP